jgi:hypothetical protein
VGGFSRSFKSNKQLYNLRGYSYDIIRVVESKHCRSYGVDEHQNMPLEGGHTHTKTHKVVKTMHIIVG